MTSCPDLPHSRLPVCFWWWRNDNRWFSGSRRMDMHVIVMTEGFGSGANSLSPHDIRYLVTSCWTIVSLCVQHVHVHKRLIFCMWSLTANLCMVWLFHLWSGQEKCCFCKGPVKNKDRYECFRFVEKKLKTSVVIFYTWQPWWFDRKINMCHL